MLARVYMRTGRQQGEQTVSPPAIKAQLPHQELYYDSTAVKTCRVGEVDTVSLVRRWRKPRNRVVP